MKDEKINSPLQAHSLNHLTLRLRSGQATQPPNYLVKTLLPILILLLATFLRLYRLPSLPPGLNFDEAGNGVAALDILHGEPKLWWTIGGGKEPLWPYVIALTTTVLGNHPLSLRFPAAVVGILTVAAVYPLILTLFRRSHPRQAYLIALLAMLGLAVSDWHLHFSRLGFRAILLPLFSTLGFYFLWQAGRRMPCVKGQPATFMQYAIRYSRNRFTIYAALFIALAVYSYLAGRMLLLIPPLFLAGYWLLGKFNSVGLRTAAPGPLVFLISNFYFVLFLFLAPLIIYFALNPADLVARATIVSIFNPTWHQGDLLGAIWRVLTLTLGTFVGFTGDSNPLVNLPGQPAIPLFLAPFFILGVIISVYRTFSPLSPHPSPFSPLSFLLVWWLVMLLPALLAPEGAPHHLRLIGTIVPTYALLAVGVTTSVSLLLTLIKRIPFLPVYRLHPWSGRWLSTVYLLPVACYLFLAFQAYTNYFIRWPTLDFTQTFDLYAVRLAADIVRSPANIAYILPMDIRAGVEARHYTLDYLADGHPYTYLPVDEPTVAARLTQVAAGKDTLCVVRWTADKHREADAKELVTFLLETQAHLSNRESFPVYDVETYAFGKTDFNPASSPQFSFPVINQPVNVVFDNILRIDNMYLQPAASPGRWLPVALTLSPLAKMDVDYKASLRLINPIGERVSQKDRVLLHNYHQGTSLWPPETVNEYYLLPVPPDAPPGEYTVTVVIYNPNTQAPLVTTSGLAELPLGRVRVE